MQKGRPAAAKQAIHFIAGWTARGCGGMKVARGDATAGGLLERCRPTARKLPGWTCRESAREPAGALPENCRKPAGEAQGNGKGTCRESPGDVRGNRTKPEEGPLDPVCVSPIQSLDVSRQQGAAKMWCTLCLCFYPHNSRAMPGHASSYLPAHTHARGPAGKVIQKASQKLPEIVQNPREYASRARARIHAAQAAT